MSDYWKKLKDPRWQKKRLKVMERDAFACRFCGEEGETLNVHHVRYKKNADPWDYEDDDLLTLCEHCHECVTTLKGRVIDHLSDGTRMLAYLHLANLLDKDEGPGFAWKLIRRLDLNEGMLSNLCQLLKSAEDNADKYQKGPVRPKPNHHNHQNNEQCQAESSEKVS